MSVIVLVILAVVLIQVGAKTLLKGAAKGVKSTIDYCREHKDDKKY